jgi:hypothetical protein
MAVIESIGVGVLCYWAGCGIASGALQLARGTALAAGALAEGDVQLAAHALARAVAVPGLGWPTRAWPSRATSTPPSWPSAGRRRPWHPAATANPSAPEHVVIPPRSPRLPDGRRGLSSPFV